MKVRCRLAIGALNMLISPSMLACDFSDMGSEIKKLELSGADMVHMDVMDGSFVPNISFGAGVIKALRKKSNLPFDVHLMIENPLKYIKDFANSGANIITFHVESNSNILETIKTIKSFGIKAGLSLRPKTDIQTVVPYLKYIDMVLIMTVEPGFGGQKFMISQMQKATLLKENINKVNPNVQIEVDGGINFETIKIVRNYPVDICVSGTCIFSAENMAKAIYLLKNG